MAISFLILHVADDDAAVTILAARLEEAGIAHELVEVHGSRRKAQRQQFRRRLLAAQAVVVVISAASADSDALLREVEFARRVKGGDEQIIPLVIGPPTAGSPFDGLPVEAVVVNELRHLDAANARDGSDPLPALRRFLAPASSYPSGYLFISYSTPNRAIVEKYARSLRDEHDIDVWWFEGRQRAGAHYRRKIMQRIKEARAVIVVLSKRSATSRSVLFEVAYARRVGTPIISIRIGDSADDPSLTAEVRHDAVVYDIRGYPLLDGRAGRDPLPDLVNLIGSPERLRAAPLPVSVRDLRGSVLDKYTVEELIATTATSAVYKAWDRDLGRPVAIKVMLPTSDRPNEQLARFQAEARRVAQLEHQHIVRLHDSWIADGQIYLVMNWMPRSLAEELPGQPLPLKRAARTFAQVATALTYAHIRGVFHCDLKPGNILLDAGGEASLADFGIAQEAHRRAGIVAFSRGYAPPEQLRGAPPQAQTDIYSLAVVLWELLTGRRLFDGEPVEVERLQREAAIPSVTTFRPELPTVLDDALRRALDPDPDVRFPDVPSFRAAIDEAFVLALRASGLPEPEVQLSVRPPELPVAPNPYKFLCPFEEADAADFFGRERLVAELLERLLLPELNGRFVAVVGPSGSGKSSVVRAGLIPAYRQLADGAGWRLEVAVIKPGTRPVESLAAALARLRGLVAEDLAEEINSDAGGLARAIDRALANEPTAELLLLIDQLEELFAPGVDPVVRRAFLAGVASAVTAPGSRTRLVVTLRADFYGAPLEEPAFGPLMHDRVVNVLPLTEQELEDAIRRPAARAGMGVESALAREIIADVAAQPGQLPLLQFALAQLYDSSVWTVLTLRGYQEIGGVEGALTTRADTVYAQFGPEAQGLAKQVFLRLVTPGDGTEDTRRRARLAELESLGAGSALVAVTDTTEQYPSALAGGADPDAPTRVHIAGAEAPQTSGLNPDAPTHSPDGPAPGATNPGSATFAPAELPTDANLVVRGVAEEAPALDEDTKLETVSADARPLSVAPAVQAQSESRGQELVVGHQSSVVPPGSTTVLQQLGQARLLSFDRDQVSGEPTVEVAHEVLFHRERGWPLLRGWLSAARDELRTQRKLSAAALEWRDSGRAVAYLATGGPLAQFEALAASGTLAFTPLERDFIAASLAERDRAAAEQEAARQRELEQARQLATEQAERAEKERELATVANLRAEEQTTSNRRLRRRAIFLAFTAIIALFASVTAGMFGLQSQSRLGGSESRRLALEAVNRINSGETELGLLLAIEAFSKEDNLSSWSALQQAVMSRPVQVKTLQGHDSSVSEAVFSLKGKHILTTSFDNTLRLWNTEGQLVAILDGHTDPVIFAAFNSSGDRIVSVSLDGSARLWASDGTFKATLKYGIDGVIHALFDSEGDYLFTISTDGHVKQWTKEGVLVSNFKYRIGTEQSFSLFHKDPSISSPLYFTEGALSDIRSSEILFHIANRFPLQYADTQARALIIAVSENGKYMVTTSNNGSFQLQSADGTLMAVLGNEDDLQEWQMRHSPISIREVEGADYPEAALGAMVTNQRPRSGSRLSRCSRAAIASLESLTPLR